MDPTGMTQHLALDLLGFSILLVIFLHSRHYGKGQHEQRIFDSMLFSTAFMLLCNTVIWNLGIAGFTGANPFLEAVTLGYYLTGLITGGLWLLYCDRKITGTKKPWKKYVPYFLPCLVGLVFAIASLDTGWTFNYDGHSRYSRGPFYVLCMILSAGYIVYAVINVATHSRKRSWIQRHDSYHLLICMLPPVIAAIVQVGFNSISLIPVSLTVSLLILFTQRQSALITADSLTGLNNHRAFEAHLGKKLQATPEDHIFFLVMIDADEFKQINDMFGHATGDEALNTIAQILRFSCDKGDFLARLGGDEFVIAGQRKNKEAIEMLQQSIQAGVEEENSSGANCYRLSLSIGCSMYNPKEHTNIDSLLQAADQQMYYSKKQRKQPLKIAAVA